MAGGISQQNRHFSHVRGWQGLVRRLAVLKLRTDRQSAAFMQRWGPTSRHDGQPQAYLRCLGTGHRLPFPLWRLRGVLSVQVGTALHWPKLGCDGLGWVGPVIGC